MEKLYQVYNPTNVPVNIVISGSQVIIEGKKMVYLDENIGKELMELASYLEFTLIEKPEPVGEAEEPVKPKKTIKLPKKLKR